MIKTKSIGKLHYVNFACNTKTKNNQFNSNRKSKCLFSEYRGKAPFVGIFTHRMPELLILDPSLVNEIFVGKFKNFHLNYTNVISVLFWNRSISALTEIELNNLQFAIAFFHNLFQTVQQRECTIVLTESICVTR